MAQYEPTDDRLVMDKLVEASFRITGMLTRLAAANDLSLTQLRVLAILRGRRPRMAGIAQELGLDRSTLTGLVDRAVTRGLIERMGDPDDGRIVYLALTDVGRDLADRLSFEMSDAVSALTGLLGGAERADLLYLLRRMLDPEPEL
ncbi:MarR family winged helix-turn-helix transcriptional regulator [Naasia lichenicola]|uniref:MarR family transcriptional regulator n=1 Tax=Naasia lichenicola TaxID=2565933 RepID=A0A4S4FL02_9MICO|nr:MarR family transcriptional regulator [Naasia lichenicola]THG29866.1 MarR family transcriptional regulator [Naasia lichenicola]